MSRESFFAEALYERLFSEGVRYFIPQCRVETSGRLDERAQASEFRVLDPSTVEVRWLGRRHAVSNRDTPFTTDQWRMINSIGMVLSGRLQLLEAEGLTPYNFSLFRGLDEDRYVSAFLDPLAYAILRDPCSRAVGSLTEGGRTTTAHSASRYGKVLKISEDGPISFYENEAGYGEL